jgi:ribosomal protein S18 acetylase RimI-like enzyme
VGVICVLAIRPAYRRKHVGTELLKRSEEYLKSFGAKEIVAGAMKPLNPFYFGLYGGGDSSGFLGSDTAAAPFLDNNGYKCFHTTLVFEKNLNKTEPVADSRFVGLRRRYDVQLLALPEVPSWWQECVLGLFEPVEFRLVDKMSGYPAARALVWEISGCKPGEQAAGILDLQVRPDTRRQGLARFLLSQLMKYVHEQYFKRVEIHCPELNHPALNLIRGLGFEQVDIGRSYSRSVEPALPAPAPAQPLASAATPEITATSSRHTLAMLKARGQHSSNHAAGLP